MINYPEKFRVGGTKDYAGIFRIPYLGHELLCVASDGLGWDHVSVSLKNRCPTWEEMCAIKELFWDSETWVMQLHPPSEKNINNCNTCLHLWAPNNGEKIPFPPDILVGIK